MAAVVGNEVMLSAKIYSGGAPAGVPAGAWWSVNDLGFDKSKILTVASVNINNYPAEVWTVKISEADMSVSGGKVEFFVSSDGETWLPAALGETISFPGVNRQRLLWRAKFTPGEDLETTPFLDRLRLDYQVKFL